MTIKVMISVLPAQIVQPLTAVTFPTKFASIDREQLSDVISKLSVQIPNVNDAAYPRY